MTTTSSSTPTIITSDVSKTDNIALAVQKVVIGGTILSGSLLLDSCGSLTIHQHFGHRGIGLGYSIGKTYDEKEMLQYPPDDMTPTYHLMKSLDSLCLQHSVHVGAPPMNGRNDDTIEVKDRQSAIECVRKRYAGFVTKDGAAFGTDDITRFYGNQAGVDTAMPELKAGGYRNQFRFWRNAPKHYIQTNRHEPIEHVTLSFLLTIDDDLGSKP